MIVLSTDAKIWLQVKRALQRLQREIDRTEPGAGGGETVMNMSCFRFAFERTFKHFLRRDIFATVQFNDTPVVERVGIARQHAFRA